MAENDQEKTEQKSQKKWDEARDKGELPRSQEVSTFVVFTIVIIYFRMLHLRWFDSFGDLMKTYLHFDSFLDLNAANLSTFLLHPVLKATLIVAPFFLIILFVSIFVNMAQTGFSLAKDKMELKFEKLDPIKGFKRMASLKQVVEGGKSVAKIGLFAYIAFVTMTGAVPEIVELPAHDLRYQIGFMTGLTLKMAIRTTILMAAFALGDYLFQWWQFQEKLKMTPREVKDELKEQEGDPLIKQRMRSIRMEMARKRMINDVPLADVIITNPTHFAVAIRYDLKVNPAPIVCAKGVEHLAARIREIAVENGVPIIENPPIARALYRHVKVGHPVPSEFYRVIAELLAFVMMLKRRPGGAGNAGKPLRPRLKSALPLPRSSARA